jgi:ComF family protein
MSILTESAEFIRRAAGKLLEQDCLLCGTASGENLLCPACSADLPRLSALHCPQCALPTPHGERCGRCLTKPPHFDATIASFSYEFPLDKLVQSFKYAHRLALGTWFGQHLAASAADCTADLIIPLPLHTLRLRERGFNQALELARPISTAHGWPIDAQVCSRIRHTPAQANLPWRDRVKNIRGAFHCKGNLTGKHIVVIDDVMTTGASLDECARTLKLHGAARVTLLVVARALPKLS